MTKKTMYDFPVELTLSKEKWGLLVMLIHQSSAMLPHPCWETGYEIAETINIGIEELEMKWEVAGEDGMPDVWKEEN